MGTGVNTNDRIAFTVADLVAVADEVQSAFGGLTVEEMNWKPSETEWSAAQCFDHLITINSFYFPIFDKLRSGTLPTTWLERISPLSGFFGRFLIKAMSPETEKKMKTSKRAYPSASEISGDIIERFVEHQSELADHIRQLPSDLDLKKIITSPLASFVTYSIDDCLTMLVVHERRHILQAKRVVRDRTQHRDRRVRKGT